MEITIIAHAPALCLTGECPTLAQFCPDQRGPHWKMVEEMLLWQGDLGTLCCILEPSQSKWKPTSSEKLGIWISWARGLPRCPSLCPAHLTLSYLAQTRPSPGSVACACAVWAGYSEQTRQHSNHSLPSCSYFLGSKVCLGSLWIDLHTPRLSDKAVPTLPVTPAGRCDSGHPRQQGEEP